MKQFVRLIKMLSTRVKFGLLLFFIFALIEAALPQLSAYIERALIERLELQRDGFSVLLTAVGALAGVMLVKKLCELIFSPVRRYISSEINFELKSRLLDKCERLSLVAFDNPKLYERLSIAKRLGSGSLTDLITGSFGLISGMIKLVSGMIVLAGISPLLLTAPIAASLTGLAYNLRSLSYEDFDKRRTGLVRRVGYFKNIATNGEFTKELKVNNMRDYVTDRYSEYNEKRNEEEMKYSLSTERMRLITDPICQLIIFALPSVVLIFSIAGEEIGVADFGYYLGMLTICYEALRGVISLHFRKLVSGVRLADYFEFIDLDEEERIGREIPAAWLEVPQTIELENVSFKYRDSDKYAIESVNLKINPGEKIALLGENGAGKTTLIKLLCGLYEPTEGKILINGIDSREFSQASLYQLSSVVFQDYRSYEMTLREALTPGISANDDEIRSALEQLDGGEFLTKAFGGDLSAKLGRTLFADGIVPSGGENQKIALARALLANKPIVIMDEATANLDVFAELAVVRTFIGGCKKSTGIMISHRVGCAAMCDRIAVLKNGRIVEQGEHSQLLLSGGEYARLYNAQACSYVK